MNWKDTARKSIMGDKVPLEELKPDKETIESWKKDDRSWTNYFFQPKKYSVKGSDRVNEVTLKNTNNLPGSLKVRIQKIAQENEGNDDFQDKDIMDFLSDEEKIELFDSQVDSFENAEMMRVIILEGYGDTNLIDPAQKETIEDFAEEVLEFKSVAQEIVKIISEFNRPLDEEKSKGSKKQ